MLDHISLAVSDLPRSAALYDAALAPLAAVPAPRYCLVVRKLMDVLADQAKAEADDRDLRSRTDARAERKRAEARLAELARRLVELSERQLGKLELADELLGAVTDARAIRSARARNRALRVVRRELRDGDAEGVTTQLEIIDPGRTRHGRRKR